jgi:hypothetical protein
MCKFNKTAGFFWLEKNESSGQLAFPTEFSALLPAASCPIRLEAVSLFTGRGYFLWNSGKNLEYASRQYSGENHTLCSALSAVRKLKEIKAGITYKRCISSPLV